MKKLTESKTNAKKSEYGMEPSIWNGVRRRSKNDAKLKAPGRGQITNFWF